MRHLAPWALLISMLFGSATTAYAAATPTPTLTLTAVGDGENVKVKITGDILTKFSDGLELIYSIIDWRCGDYWS